MHPKIDTRVTIILGTDLYKAVLMGAVEAGHNPSQEIRTRLAKSYGLPPPEMKQGNPDAIAALKTANKSNPKHSHKSRLPKK